MAFDNLDSTNTALRRMVEAGTEAAEGLIVTAKSQSAGRGRSGRIWSSPPGNLYASVVVAGPEEQSRAPELGFVAAVAVIAAIQSLLPDHASDAVLRCKWPNDVLFEGAKVSGILLETADAPEASLPFVIIGVGINLMPVEVAEAMYPITSLAEHGRRVTPTQALEAHCRQLAHHLDIWRRGGFGPIRELWLDHAEGLDEPITVKLHNETITGRFTGLDADGALMVEQTPGNSRRILAGDVMATG